MTFKDKCFITHLTFSMLRLISENRHSTVRYGRLMESMTAGTFIKRV